MLTTMATGWIVAGSLLMALGGALEAGFRLGRRVATQREDPGGGQVGAIQGAVLGLLGLLALVVLIAAGLWTTIDLDHPRAGLIRLSDAPLQELKLR